MSRPVVIVDPLSSGTEIAPVFRARGIPAIAVKLQGEEWPEFGAKLRSGDFEKIFPEQPGLAEILRELNPLAIIAGTEEGIPLAERLTEILLPHLANDPAKARHRRHKSLMQDALREAGVPSLRSFVTSSEGNAEAWIRESGLAASPLILKPPMSSGSELVFHVGAGEDWRRAFRRILREPSVITGHASDSVVLQEQAIGQEYAVGTVSADGRHDFVHLIKYNKMTVGEHRTVYDHVEFVAADDDTIFDYVRAVLDALGIRWGATHTEIMMTKDGPRLIETSARMIGGPVVGFARAATGSSQADRLVEAYAGGNFEPKGFSLKKTVVPVFLKAANAGITQNLESLDRARGLPTFLSQHVWIKNGDRVPRTVDYLTSIGIIALAGDRDAIFADYEKVRALETELIFAP